MAELVDRYGVKDFHLEDDDFTSDRGRILSICDEIAARDLHIELALPSGVRSEPLDDEVLGALARAGCRYISLAPESGSARVLRAMGKPIDTEQVVSVAAAAARHGIKVGAFIVLGFPGEERADRWASAQLVRRLVAAGVDDLSVFVWSPMPGAASFGQERGYSHLEELCWSPRWRGAYWRLEGARVGIYARAIAALLRHRPVDVLRRLNAVRTGQFQTKGEMTLARILR